MRWSKFKLSFFICLLSVTSVFALTYQIKTQRVNVTTAATKLPTTPLVGREYLQVQNIGTVTIYLGDSTVTANTAPTGGLQILPYAVWRDEYDHTVDVYGIIASGTSPCIIEEGK